LARNLNEAQTLKPRDDLARLEDRDRAHLGDLNRLRADELGFYLRVTIFKQHADHFSQIRLKLIQAIALAMGTGEAWHVTDVDTGLGVAFDNSGECIHGPRFRSAGLVDRLEA
jgi:hypothetical protein